MYEFERAPIDSYDLYAMGLRAARCNGCKLAEYKHKLGDKFLMLDGTVYELDAEPHKGQAVTEHEGRPIKFRFGGMSYGHSDECYNWNPSHLKRTYRSPYTGLRKRMRTKRMYHRASQRPGKLRRKIKAFLSKHGRKA
jgi:hypothetical protein